MEKIRWTERADGKGPLFGTFVNDTKVEDNFNSDLVSILVGFKPIGRITHMKGICNCVGAPTNHGN